jgi:micrococcal nuclease
MTTGIRAARLFALLLLACSVPAHAERFEGVVTHVTDGDTLWVRPATGGAARPIRIEGIDAPEICQPFGDVAREALARRALRQHVVVTGRGRDDFDRTLARVHLQGDDLGAWMVSRGHAWSYRFRADRGPYAREESQARRARLGFWSESPRETPRDFRKRHGSCKLP